MEHRVQQAPLIIRFVPAGLRRVLKRALLTPFMRWYTHHELPRFGHLLHWYGMNDQPNWADAPTVEVRERIHGYRMKLDLSDFFQRINYFCGCYHELDVLSAISAVLRPGDEFIDGGANIGLLTLHAAGIVGPKGVVHAVEPNPVVFERLTWHVERNDLSQVRTHRTGLSDESASLHVRLPGFDNQAAATLGPIPQRYAHHIEELGAVETIRGDDLLLPPAFRDDRPLTIKLDIEGFEFKALRGFGRTLRQRRPALILELNAELLALNDSSPSEVAAFLDSLGYRCFALDRMGFRGRHRLVLRPLSPEQVIHEKDLLWLVPDTVHWRRAEALMRPWGELRRAGAAINPPPSTPAAPPEARPA